MGISNVLRGVGRGVASVGRAVQAASTKLDQTVMPPAPAQVAAAAPATAPAPESSPTAPAPRGFSLPDLGPGPDPGAPEFQGDEGKKKLEDAQRDFQHKQDIHKAFRDLDAIYTQAHPGRDFQGEYQQALAEQTQHEQERPKANPLAKGALALGDFNPAVQKSGRSNLDTYNANVEQAQQRSDTGFAQRMTLRAKMHEQAAADAAAQGDWKKALAENEKLALLKADEESLGHQRKMEEIKTIQSGQTERAKIRRDAVERSANIRAGSIAHTHGLTGSFLDTFNKEAARAMAKFLGPKDITKDYTPEDVDQITNYVENIAEMLHNQQYGTEDGGTGHIGTFPTNRKPPKGKEQF